MISKFPKKKIHDNMDLSRQDDRLLHDNKVVLTIVRVIKTPRRQGITSPFSCIKDSTTTSGMSSSRNENAETTNATSSMRI